MSEQEQAAPLDLSDVTNIFGADPVAMKDGVWHDIPGTDGDRLKIAFVSNLKFAQAIENKVRNHRLKSKLNEKDITVVDRSFFALQATSELRLVDWDITRGGNKIPYTVAKSFELISASTKLDAYVSKTSREMKHYSKQLSEANIKKS